METPKPNNTTTNDIQQQINEANKKLDEKTKLNWLEKITIRRLIKKAKKDLKKELRKARENNITKQELNNRIDKAIIDMKEHFDILIDQYDENEQPIKNKQGKNIEVEATNETLQNLSLNKKIETFEDILEEMQKIV